MRVRVGVFCFVCVCVCVRNETILQYNTTAIQYNTPEDILHTTIYCDIL